MSWQTDAAPNDAQIDLLDKDWITELEPDVKRPHSIVIQT